MHPIPDNIEAAKIKAGHWLVEGRDVYRIRDARDGLGYKTRWQVYYSGHFTGQYGETLAECIDQIANER